MAFKPKTTPARAGMGQIAHGTATPAPPLGRVSPPWMTISRRQLLALGTATAAAGALTTGGTLIQWWDQPPAASFKALSPPEAAFVRAWAGAAFPPGDTLAIDGGTAGLDHFFDATLLHLPAMQRKLIKLLLHALDTGSIAFAGRTFSQLPAVRARAVFHQLSAHDLAEVRGAASSLTVLLGMGYSTHPEVAPVMARWHRCGYG